MSKGDKHAYRKNCKAERARYKFKIILLIGHMKEKGNVCLARHHAATPLYLP